MTDPGFRGITIKKELHDALQKRYAEETKGKRVKLSFTAWVSQILWNALESPAR
jgi:hypothetical protein